jgi:hypothetical protein
MSGLNADRRAILAITLAWVAALLIVRPWGNVPNNDDWSWMLAVDSLVTHHTWHLTDSTGMPLATQIVWGSLFCLPFGVSFTALRLSGFVIAWIALVGIYALLKECGATRAQASLGTVAVLLSPSFASLSLSFMTDIPFLACSVWAIVYTLRYQREERPAQFVAIVAWLVAATLQRQLGVPLALAIAVGLAVFPGRWLRAAVSAAVPLAAIGAYNAAIDHFGAPYYYHTRGDELMFRLLSASQLVLRAAAVTAVGSYVYLGVLMTPVVLASRLIRWRSRLAIVCLAALVIVPGAGILYKHQWMPIDQSSLWNVGLNPILFSRADLWPKAPHTVWIAITLVGLICAAVVWREIACIAARDWRTVRTTGISRRAIAPVVTLSASLALSTTPLWFVFTFDRYYLWPFVLLLALWTRLQAGAAADRATTRRPWTAAAVAVLACLGLFDVVALHDYYAFTRARWAAVDALRAAGVAGEDIDGGFEVNGLLSYHADQRLDPEHPWYAAKMHPAALLSLGPVDGFTASATYEFPRWMPPGTGVVYVLRPSGSLLVSRD